MESLLMKPRPANRGPRPGRHAVADECRLDAELIERFVVGRDGGAFARLVDRHGPLVLGACRRVLRHHHDSEEAFQDLHAALDEELGRLPDRYRVPLVLCCLAGRMRDDAAARLGWGSGTMKMHLERGRRLLGARLAHRGLCYGERRGPAARP
jgi:DNA-directed RNA polymerase specialized sigma24 family protein